MDEILTAQGFRLTVLEPDGTERVAVEVEPDEGGRGIVEHGLCVVATHMRKVWAASKGQEGLGGVSVEVKDLGRYVFAWLYEVGFQSK